MFDRRLAWTGAALAVVAAVSFFLTRAPEESDIAPITENVSGIERSASSAPVQRQKQEYAYILKAHEGRVAVFPAGSSEPEFVYDVLVKYLPDYDRQQMEEGIPVRDYDELVSLLEDYTS